MKRAEPRWWACWIAVIPALTAAVASAEQDDPAASSGEILIGVEYAMLGRAEIFGGLGIPAVKHFPPSVSWGKMQRSRGAPIDFSKMDRFVREYQAAGFRELVFGLKSVSTWASKSALKNVVPKPESMPLYERWIGAVVERYDGDGREDMPGLVHPIRWFEIGTELSGFEPGPIDEHLAMLQHAYRAAHAASDEVVIAHLAFLPATVFNELRRSDRDAAAGITRSGGRRRLDEMRAILSRPDLYDALNFHALGDPYEIEYTVAWLREETRHWEHPKPILISDTAPNPLIGWGPATSATGPKAWLGMLIPPSTEEDRPRLAAFFNKLLEGDEEALHGTWALVADDNVKKVVIAAEQGVALINTSFTEDMPLFKAKWFRAAAGISPWGGMVELKRPLFSREWTVVAHRPVFHAVKQLQGHIRGYTSVERVDAGDERVRLYRFGRPRGTLWVAWYAPGKVVLPGEPMPTLRADLPLGPGRFVMERMIDRPGQTDPEQGTVLSEHPRVSFELGPRPVYLRAGR